MMFRVILLCLCVSSAFGQRFTLKVDAPGTHVVYPRLNNDISVTVENHRCEDIILTTDNGKIEKSEGCYFNWQPDSIGRGCITVKVKTAHGIKTIGQDWYMVKTIPRLSPELGGKQGGEMKKQNFKAQLGIVEQIGIHNLDARLPISRFSVIVVRDNEVVFAKNNKGPVFAGQVKQFFQNEIETGDEVLFFDIFSSGPDDEQPVPPMQLKITAD